MTNLHLLLSRFRTPSFHPSVLLVPLVNRELVLFGKTLPRCSPIHLFSFIHGESGDIPAFLTLHFSTCPELSSPFECFGMCLISMPLDEGSSDPFSALATPFRFLVRGFPLDVIIIFDGQVLLAPGAPRRPHSSSLSSNSRTRRRGGDVFLPSVALFIFDSTVFSLLGPCSHFLNTFKLSAADEWKPGVGKGSPPLHPVPPSMVEPHFNKDVRTVRRSEPLLLRYHSFVIRPVLVKPAHSDFLRFCLFFLFCYSP